MTTRRKCLGRTAGARAAPAPGPRPWQRRRHLLRAGVVALAVAWPASSAPAQQRSDSPAAVRTAELVDRASAGDWTAAAAWIRDAFAPAYLEQFTVENRVNLLASLRHGTGGFDVHEITSDGTTKATVVFGAPLTGAWRAITVTVEPEPPHRIVGLAVGYRPPPAERQPEARSLPPGRAAVELDAYIRRLAEAELFSGTVLVARGGEVLFQNAYGDASREFGVPNRLDTRFNLASITKMFTAVAILQLMEQGKLSLDDTLHELAPGVLAQEVAERVRIEHLLSHTSGLGDFLFVPEMWQLSRANFRTIADYLPRIATSTLAFEPGTKWGYSNTGYHLLGVVIERVSGQSYDDYLAAHVFAPAGMTATGAADLDLVPRGVAGSYQREFVNGEMRFRSDRYVMPIRGVPAGGMVSTATDLWRFMEALRSHRLLSPETTRLMLAAKPELQSPTYGFGVIHFAPGGNQVGHSGGAHGVATFLELDREHDLVVVVLGNQNGGSNYVRHRARQLFGAGTPTQSW